MMIAIVQDVKKLLRELVSAIRDRDSVIVQSADSDIEIIRERQSRLEGAILMLADRINDSGETNLQLREFIRAMDSNAIVPVAPMRSEKFSLLATGIKQSPKLDMIKQWLKDNPDTELSNRQIAKSLGVSSTWVNLARKEVS